MLFPAHERFLIGRDPHGITAIFLIIYIADIPSAVAYALFPVRCCRCAAIVHCRVFTLCKTAYHILPFHISFLEEELPCVSRRESSTIKKNERYEKWNIYSNITVKSRIPTSLPHLTHPSDSICI